MLPAGWRFSTWRIAGGALSFFLYAWALGRAAPTTIMILLPLNPIAALVAGSLWLGEPLGLGLIGGLLLVIIGVLLVVRPSEGLAVPQASWWKRRPMKVLVLSNINMQPLVAALGAVGRRVRRLQQHACRPRDDELAGNRARHLARHLLLRHRHLDGRGALRQRTARPVRDVPLRDRRFLRAQSRQGRRHQYVLPGFAAAGSALRISTTRPRSRRLEMQLNGRLAAIAKTRPNLLVFDLDVIFRRHGEDALVSNAFWYVGRIRYTAKMFDLLGRPSGAPSMRTPRGAARCWSSISTTRCGAASSARCGPIGITLSARTAQDVAFATSSVRSRHFARPAFCSWHCSKNNLADVEEVFEQNPMMVLGARTSPSFAPTGSPRPRISSRSRTRSASASTASSSSTTTRSSASDVAKFLPEVAVPGFPERSEDLPSWFLLRCGPRLFRQICDHGRGYVQDRAVSRQRSAPEDGGELRPRRLSGRARTSNARSMSTWKISSCARRR